MLRALIGWQRAYDMPQCLRLDCAGKSASSEKVVLPSLIFRSGEERLGLTLDCTVDCTVS